MPDDTPKSSLRLRALVLASLGSVAATVVISRFGLAGTVIGAAVAPIVVLTTQELVRRPADRLADVSRSATRRVSSVRYRDAGGDGPRWRVGGNDGADDESQAGESTVVDDGEAIAGYAEGSTTPVQPPARPAGAVRSWWQRVRWRLVVVASVLAFGLTVGGFSAVEAFTGKSVVANRPSTFGIDDNPPVRHRPSTTTTPTTPTAATTASTESTASTATTVETTTVTTTTTTTETTGTAETVTGETGTTGETSTEPTTPTETGVPTETAPTTPTETAPAVPGETAPTTPTTPTAPTDTGVPPAGTPSVGLVTPGTTAPTDTGTPPAGTDTAPAGP